jgi:hypothetical protein
MVSPRGFVSPLNKRERVDRCTPYFSAIELIQGAFYDGSSPSASSIGAMVVEVIEFEVMV